MRIGLIGLGRWGKNYLTALSKFPEIELVHVAGRIYQKPIADEFPVMMFSEDWHEVCCNNSLHGIIVATSPQNHYEVASLALSRGIPILVEKPFTLCSDQTLALFNLSRNTEVFCMVNYIHLFSPGYQDLKSNIIKCGKVMSIFSEGYSSGPYRTGVPVLWDWGCHDLAMCIDLLDEAPDSIRMSELATVTEDPRAKLLILTMSFPSKVMARSVVGNASEFKRRDFCVVCEDGCFVYDGLSAGLSKQFSLENFSYHAEGFRIQRSSLDCAVHEFVTSLKLGCRNHHTLELAVKVNQTLATLY